MAFKIRRIFGQDGEDRQDGYAGIGSRLLNFSILLQACQVFALWNKVLKNIATRIRQRVLQTRYRRRRYSKGLPDGSIYNGANAFPARKFPAEGAIAKGLPVVIVNGIAPLPSNCASPVHKTVGAKPRSRAIRCPALARDGWQRCAASRRSKALPR